MRRKIIGISLVILLMFVLVPSALAASTIKATINGSFINFDQPPVIINGRTLVPIRAISENLGATVSWKPETQTVVIFRNDGGQIQIGIGKTTATVDGNNVKVDVPAKIINGRTMVPIRFVGEALGLKVDWIASTNTVAMTSNGKTTPQTDSLVEIDNQIKQAKTDYENASLHYGQLLQTYPAYSIIGEIKSTGSDYIIVYGSAIGSSMGLGKGYMKILNPSESGIQLYIYTGIHFYVGTETDFTYGNISVFDNGPKELRTAKNLMDDAQFLIDNLTNERNILVEKINGIKEVTYENGDYYKGTFDSAGNPHGNGTYKWANGDVYTGDWDHGQRIGKGKYVWQNGDICEGDFINGILDGEGVMKTGFHKEGTLLGSYVPEYYFNEYTGGFKDGLYHGQGTLIHKPDPLSYAANADLPFKYVGEFIKGKFEGVGTLYDYDGNVVSNGVWKNGNIVEELPIEEPLDENTLQKNDWYYSGTDYYPVHSLIFLSGDLWVYFGDYDSSALGKIESINKDGDTMTLKINFYKFGYYFKKDSKSVAEIEKWKSFKVSFIDKDTIKVVIDGNQELLFSKNEENSYFYH